MYHGPLKSMPTADPDIDSLSVLSLTPENFAENDDVHLIHRHPPIPSDPRVQVRTRGGPKQRHNLDVASPPRIPPVYDVPIDSRPTVQGEQGEKRRALIKYLSRGAGVCVPLANL